VEEAKAAHNFNAVCHWNKPHEEQKDAWHVIIILIFRVSPYQSTTNNLNMDVV